jgi:hypothetical protein
VLGTEPPLVSVFVFGRRVVARVHEHAATLGVSFRSRMLFIKVVVYRIK